MNEKRKAEYEAPVIRTYDAGELEEELGFTNGSVGYLDLEGGGETEDVED